MITVGVDRHVLVLRSENEVTFLLRFADHRFDWDSDHWDSFGQMDDSRSVMH